MIRSYKAAFALRKPSWIGKSFNAIIAEEIFELENSATISAKIYNSLGQLVFNNSYGETTVYHGGQ